MVTQEEVEIQEDSPGIGPAFLVFSALTTAILLVLLSLVALPSLGRADGRPGVAPKTQPRSVAAGITRTSVAHRQSTIIYLVSSQAAASKLDDALNEWRLEIEALGVPDQPRRLVVLQTPDDVLHQRFIDFTILATQAPGLDLQVIDRRD
jgi:hypothetical protein